MKVKSVTRKTRVRALGHGLSRLSIAGSFGATTQKKARKQELTAIDKFLNKMISRVRIVVENVIGGVKRCLDCERRIKTDQREDFRRDDGDCLWLAQLASNIPTTNAND